MKSEKIDEYMSDPKKCVDDYLKKEGYPLEMKVAREFANAGFAVEQCPMFTDTTSGKLREIDVVAFLTTHLGSETYGFKVIIECKHIVNPWIIFTNEQRDFGQLGIHNFYLGNYPAMEFLKKISLKHDISFQGLFKINKKFGYGLTETKKGSDNKQERKLTYEGTSKIIDSLIYEFNSTEQFPSAHVARFFVPVIVIEGKFFEAFLNDKNDIESNEIDEGQLIYKSDNMFGVYPLIEICTIDKLPNLVNKLKSDFDKMLKENQSVIQEFSRDFPKYNKPVTGAYSVSVI